MSALAFAAFSFAAGTYEKYLRREGRLEGADERRRAAKGSLLTASYNIRKRKEEGRQTQFQVLETGGNLIKQIAIKGLQAEGKAAVAGAAAGVVIDSGTPRAALSNIVQETISAQTDAIIATRNRIKAIERQTTNINTSEWRNAKLNQKQQNRIADRETKAADREWIAGMFNTGVRTFGIYKTASRWER